MQVENFLPSLEHIAVAKIAIAVCYHPSFVALLKEMTRKEGLINILEFDVSEERWDILQHKILEILQSTELTWVVKKKVIGVMKPMLCQIHFWENDHNDVLELGLPLKRLCWKAEGTIDRKKTAKVLIRDEAIEIHARFILACNYCLADDVRDLWKRMSDTQRAKLYRSEDFASQLLIVRLWIDSIKGGTRVDWKRLARECSTDIVVLKDNSVALPNFFENLTSRQKRRCLRNLSRSGYLQSDYLRLCLPHLNEEGKMELLKEEPVGVISCLLEWPLQGMFIDAANSVWSHISQSDFRYLLRFILRSRIALGWSDFDYFELFQSFWRLSPAELKEFVRTDKIFPSVMFVIDHVQNKPFSRQCLLELLGPIEKNFDLAIDLDFDLDLDLD